ncbi:hypothetical protein [Methylobacterium nigriterrae]|uniref:hypothetical protein n=1 Tax=Methylobacterium nigriterrae TaxID=3127512 RepID=UPI0030141B35
MAAQVISARFERTWRNIAGAVSVRTNEDRTLFDQLLPANRCLTADELIRLARRARRQRG